MRISLFANSLLIRCQPARRHEMTHAILLDCRLSCCRLAMGMLYSGRRVWQLAEAKSKLSQVIDEALASGPQIITRRGVETAILISYEEYKTLRKPQTSLVDFFRNSPLYGLDLDLE